MPAVTDEVFVVAWQRCVTLSQAAKACGYDDTPKGRNSCGMRAKRLRLAGVPLKTLTSRKDVRRLQWLATKALEEMNE